MIDTKYPFNILFVEDEKELRKNYVAYLKMFFEEVYEAEDGEMAYKIYKQKKPHIMIVDINLPDLSGIDLLKRIRENDHTTKVIMLTAYTDKNFLFEAISLKLTRYLVKPISRNELKDALNIVIKELSNFNTLPVKKINLKESYNWNYELKELSHNSKLIYLTNKEKIIFNLLISNLGETFSSDTIIYEAWDDYDEGSLDRLKTTIKTLRRKLPKDTIKNVFGIGYKID